MKKIYVLEHFFEKEDLFEEIRVLGIYSTKENAELALEGLKNDPFLTTCPEDFVKFSFFISIKNVNEVAFSEGYVSY